MIHYKLKGTEKKTSNYEMFLVYLLNRFIQTLPKKFHGQIKFIIIEIRFIIHYYYIIN